MATTNQLSLPLDFTIASTNCYVTLHVAHRERSERQVCLGDHVRKNGFNYKVVFREGRKCIYEQTVLPDLLYYEAFIVQISPKTILNGIVLPEREVFPGNEDFGNTAWSCRTFADAMERLKLKGNRK